MELITKNEQQVVYKEVIEYVDKKTGELKQLNKLYITDTTTGIQEQILVNKETYANIQKGEKGKAIFDKTEYGCYLKGFNPNK